MPMPRYGFTSRRRDVLEELFAQRALVFFSGLLALAVGMCITLGYPIIVAYLLFKYRAPIKMDQALRAAETGYTPDTNPQFKTRQMLSKLYKNYKPKRYMWILVILARKCFIAGCTMIWKSNTTFQLSMALLVMFFSYCAQTQYNPYMSMEDRAAVVKAKHKEKKATFNARITEVANIKTRDQRDAAMEKANEAGAAMALTGGLGTISGNTKDVVGEILQGEDGDELMALMGPGGAMGDGGPKGDGADHQLLGLMLELVEPAVGGDHLLGRLDVATLDGVERLVEQLLGQAAHLGDLGADAHQLLVEGRDGMAPGSHGGHVVVPALRGRVSRSGR